MPNIGWKDTRNLENSLVEFLDDTITAGSLTIPDMNGDSKKINVVAGFEIEDNWDLPIISVYVDTKSLDRLSVGSNKRFKTFLLIIDIRTFDIGSRLDLTEWVEETINDGFTFYEYSPNPSDPPNPNKTANGKVSIDFVSNIPLNLGENVELFDKYRQNITLSCTISNS